MFEDRIEGKWIDTFVEILAASAVQAGDPVALLSETQSRALNVHLAELAALRLGAKPYHIVVPTPRNPHPVPVRSTGASQAIQGLEPVIAALSAAPIIVDLTVEGLMHAPETPRLLKAGARILVICDEHPEALERLRLDPAQEALVKAHAKRCREAKTMRVTSPAGTDLTIDMTGASTVGVWGATTRPGTLTHVPAGLVVSFPARSTVHGRLVIAPGDVNLTFKRYVETAIDCRIEDDHIVAVEGAGVDAELMRRGLAAWGEKAAYAVSHVGYGLNPRARYEALTAYDKRDTNGTELRALAGNFLFSTGANEFAGRFTAGHFDIPMMGTTITLDGVAVVRDGAVV